MENGIELSLDNVVIGKKLRIFQGCAQGSSKGEMNTYYSMRDSESNEDMQLLKKNDLKYNYFMKENDSVRLSYSYSDDFVNSLKTHLSSNASNQNTKSVFYEHDILSLNPKDDSNIIQFGGKYYFINNDVFDNDINLINGKYEITPTIKSGKNQYIQIPIQSTISSHIGTLYDSSFYDESLKCINDKSIPIYDLSENALNSIQILKFNDGSVINSIIEKFDLHDIREKILFNSKTNNLSLGTFDSLFIPPIIDKYLNDPTLFESEKQAKLSNLFEFIFSNLSLNSFYRLLIPVGKISNISNTKKHTQTINAEEYVYYINVNNLESLTRNIQFNYFSLKNFKNPHDEHDYEIFDINTEKSCAVTSYDFYQTQQFNLLNFIDSSISELRQLINLSHASVLSGTYIDDMGLVPDMIQQSLEVYTNWTKDLITKTINIKDSWLRNKAFLNYFKNVYDKNLVEEPYIITTNEIISFMDEKKSNFKNSYKSLWGDDVILSGYYAEGLTIFNQINETIKHITSSNKNDDSFITNLQAISIKKEDLSVNFFNNLKSFKHGMYKPLIETVLGKAEVEDKSYSSIWDWYKSAYETRFSSKIYDYYNCYNSYFTHENIMKKDGSLFGFRTYNYMLTSLNNKLYMTYNYFTTYDKKLLSKFDLHNDVEILINSVTNTWDLDEFENIKDINSLLDVSKIRISPTKVLALKESTLNENRNYSDKNDKRRQFLSYAKTLHELKNIEFVDYIEGFNKYKETEISKSNVYSIELVNSNLNYEVITFDEMVNVILNKDSSYTFNKLTYTFERRGRIYKFIDLVNEMGYARILDTTLNKDIGILEKSGLEIPMESYKFYNKNNDLNVNIETKMEMRKQVEQAIRKSIHRYAPVNTTLWKIKYSGL